MWSAPIPLACLVTSAACAVSPQTSAGEIPANAAVVVAAVNKAASAKNYVALKKMMAPEFTWSFSGDGNADQALEAWKREPGYLRSLARVTSRKCVYRTDRYVECPAKAGTAFRAGFKEVAGVWRMEYFVEGD